MNFYKGFNSRLFFMLGAAVILSCATGGDLKGGRQVSQTADARAQAMMQKIDEINAASPDSYVAHITSQGVSNKNKYNSVAEILFLKNPRVMKASFADMVFRSPITTFIQEGENIRIYFPMDKVLYQDTVPTISLRNYTGIDIEFRFLYPILIGQIPLITNYSVKSGLSEDTGGAPTEYLILENDGYFQTIAFSEGVPQKLLFVNKAGQDRVEIYLDRPIWQGKTLHYRDLKLVIPSTGEKLTITFNDIAFNTQLDAAAVTYLLVPPGTKVVSMY